MYRSVVLNSIHNLVPSKQFGIWLNDLQKLVSRINPHNSHVPSGWKSISTNHWFIKLYSYSLFFQNGICEESNIKPQRKKRKSRELHDISNNQTSKWETKLAFRVQMPDEDTKFNGSRTDASTFLSKFTIFISMFGLCLFLTLVSIMIYLTIRLRK